MCQAHIICKRQSIQDVRVMTALKFVLFREDCLVYCHVHDFMQSSYPIQRRRHAAVTVSERFRAIVIQSEDFSIASTKTANLLRHTCERTDRLTLNAGFVLKSRQWNFNQLVVVTSIKPIYLFRWRWSATSFAFVMRFCTTWRYDILNAVSSPITNLWIILKTPTSKTPNITRAPCWVVGQFKNICVMTKLDDFVATAATVAACCSSSSSQSFRLSCRESAGVVYKEWLQHLSASLAAEVQLFLRHKTVSSKSWWSSYDGTAKLLHPTRPSVRSSVLQSVDARVPRRRCGRIVCTMS